MTKRPKPTNAEIMAVYDEIENIDPEISTERLLSLVCDHFGGRINHGDVARAIAGMNDEESQK